MAGGSRNSRVERRRVSAFLVVSVCLHVLVLTIIGYLYYAPDRGEKEPVEVVLVEQPPPAILPQVPENSRSVEVRSSQPVANPNPDARDVVVQKKIEPDSSDDLSERLAETEKKTSEREETPRNSETTAVVVAPDSSEDQTTSAPVLDTTIPVEEKPEVPVQTGPSVAEASKKSVHEDSRSPEGLTEEDLQVAVLAVFPRKVREAVWSNFSFASPETIVELSSRERRIFHNYFVGVHETRIHPRFAKSFLKRLDERHHRDPLNNRNLRMFAEFSIDEDGVVGEVRVVRPSGNLVFDAGAVASIFEASPFPKPPRAIRSWNGRVYMRWGFHRDSRKCGVFNAQPYILEKRKTTRVALANSSRRGVTK